MLSQSDLSHDAINVVKVAHKSEVSSFFFFLFETVEEVVSDREGVCGAEAVSTSSSSSFSSSSSLRSSGTSS
jgi:hypothetical protein